MLASVALPCPAGAQDLIISNARIIVGNGSVIDSGTLVVRGGRIASVGAGATAPAGVRQIDARGMTIMPGFIDGHRHIISGNAEQWLKDQATRRMENVHYFHEQLKDFKGLTPVKGHPNAARRTLHLIMLRYDAKHWN